MEKKCCFTGYRPVKLKYLYNKDSVEYKKLYTLLQETIEEAVADGYNYFISGFAMGVDLMAAEIVLQLKTANAHIKLEAALPCMNQTVSWSSVSQEKYFALLDKADYRSCVHPKGMRESYLMRNRYMVENSDRVIAVYDGRKGGTSYTVDYARKHKREVIVIDPQILEITEREYSLFK
ncbi:MAG: SLOG family protein [Clostridiales bacterium]